MLSLKSESLTVSVLHPVAEKDKLGTRYCTAGFIFQVEDAARGALLSGPTFPDSYNLYDGQGAPDAFQPHLVLAEAADGTPTLVLGIGIGVIDIKAGSVVERVAWTIDEAEGWLAFRATQAAGPWSFTLERTLTLRGRTLKSETFLFNTCPRHVPFQWYPHPFFPLYPTGECCKVSVPITLPDNPGYVRLGNGFLQMKHFPWKDEENHFQLLGHPGDRPVSFLQKHPVTSIVAAACDYVPGRLPVWGNGCTFSFEPYYERNLSPQDSARWSITYDF